PEVIKTKVERSVTMLPKVEEVLRARAARLAREGKSAKGLVFLTAKGRPWTDVALSDRFAKLRKKCVKLNLIAEENAGERLVAYSARHTRGTEMLRQGVDIALVSKELGHKHISTTLDRYIHLSGLEVTEVVLRKAREAEAATPPGGSAG